MSIAESLLPENIWVEKITYSPKEKEFSLFFRDKQAVGRYDMIVDELEERKAKEDLISTIDTEGKSDGILRVSIKAYQARPADFVWALTLNYEESRIGVISTQEYYKVLEDLGLSGPDRQPDEPSGPPGSDNVSPVAGGDEPKAMRMAAAMGAGGHQRKTIQPAKDRKPGSNNQGRS